MIQQSTNDGCVAAFAGQMQGSQASMCLGVNGGS